MFDIPLRVIRKNHTLDFPSHVMYIDVETKKRTEGRDEYHRLKLGWTCYQRYNKGEPLYEAEWRRWFDTESLCRYIDGRVKEGTSLYLFGHNVYFDLQSSDFMYFFPLWGYTCDFVYDEGLTYILVIRKGKKTIRAVSSTNYYDFALDKLAVMLGMDKGKIDFDTVSEEELSDYCKNDVLILKTAMEKYYEFIRENEMGKFSLTKASQAMSCYRHRFMEKKLHVHQSEEVVKLERLAYFGGRTECFRLGVQPVQPYVSLDINSMYPFIMRNFKLPTKLVDYQENPLSAEVHTLLKNYSVIAEVMLSTEEPAYAVRGNQKILFPVGEFKTFLCTGGLQYAFDHGHVKEVLRASIYKNDYIFSGYVDHFYEQKASYRADGNLVMESLCKKFLNCLYGKFGERRWVEARSIEKDGLRYYRIDCYDQTTGDHWIEYKLFNTYFKKLYQVEGPRSIVSIPAHITEYARLLLWKIIDGIGRENVYYCDTDSIIIRADDLGRVDYPLDDAELGCLGTKETFETLELYGCKHYTMGGVVKIKGVPKTARKLDEYRYGYYEFMGQSSHMEQKLDRVYKLKWTEKDVTPSYDKGIVNFDGTISPFVFGRLGLQLDYFESPSTDSPPFA